MLKKILKAVIIILGAVVLVAAAGIGALTAMEYRPAPVQSAERVSAIAQGVPAGRSLSVCAWNIGYGGLGRDSDFVMDGGSMVNPPSPEAVERNIAAITEYMRANPADVWFVQEADTDAYRTGGEDQFALLQNALGMNGAFAYNFNCAFVPFPVPPIGRVKSGIATFTGFETSEAPARVSLHCPFSWPVRVANMKRCLLVSRVPVEGTDRELVLVNLHLEAYESGEGRIAQTSQLMSLLEDEYAKGNYVIAGGDFNQMFPGTEEIFPVRPESPWVPGRLQNEDLPENWRFAVDTDGATCRLLDAPYSPDTQLFVIDGFILSPNVEMVSVETVPLDFENSDHNPVRLQVNLM